MQHDADCSDEAENAPGGQIDNELGDDYTGFLVMKLKIGEMIMVGDTIISINQTKMGRCCLAIRAKRTTVIKRLP